MKDLAGKVAVITGGTGVLGYSMAEGLVAAGVKVAILSRTQEKADGKAAGLRGEAVGFAADPRNRESLEAVLASITEKWGTPDFLINAAGGNDPAATAKVEQLDRETNPDDGFFGMDVDAIRETVDLNLVGTILPSMVIGRAMVERGSGVIINISSMSAFHPLTKVGGYSFSKAAVSSFTEWLAVHLAKTGVRVNAIAPGFFLTEQNRFLLTDKDTGEMTARGGKIIAATPQERFGKPEELQGLLLYLLSDGAAFTTGTVIPVDGGFNAYAGV
jgi:NAD(P)-dependent dehydrogenase (short-subunit alcohol dehydrogenase family)